MKRKGFDEGQLLELIAGGSVRECKVARHGEDRWACYVRLGGPASSWLAVRSQREAVRTWASLDTLERFTSSLGIRTFAVES